MNSHKLSIMLNLVFLVGFLSVQSMGFSQSKKKQIEALNFKIDSVNYKLTNNRKIHHDELNKSISQNKQLDIIRLSNRDIIQEVNFEMNTRKNEVSDLKKENESLTTEIQKLKDSLKNLSRLNDFNALAFETVKIGIQTWMAENLNVTKFRNEDPIPEALTLEEWIKSGEKRKPAWCYYDNDPKKGKLYNWYAVNDPRGLAPEGWHIPSSNEWKQLINYFGGAEEAGNKLRSNSNISNKSEELIINHFYSVPSGIRDIGIRETSKNFYDFGVKSYWWTSSKNDIYNPEYLAVYSSKFISIDNQYPIFTGWHYNDVGMSVRCVKD